jgi:enterochelin esterase-like enzyme
MRAITCCAAFLALVTISAAQDTPPEQAFPPEVHADGTVTLKVRTRGDAIASVHGDWMRAGETVPMKRGEDIWWVTTRAISPGQHTFWFEFESDAIPKPEDVVIKRTVTRTPEETFEIRGSATPWEPRNVPHGVVLNEMTGSAVLHRADPAVIYLPPGYYASRARRYPVLYLLHGSPGAADNWVNMGHANVIMDNLIADGKATPMIVVMPTTPLQARNGRGSSRDLFDNFLVEDLMRIVELRYRVAPGSANRALAGVSAGGALTIYSGFNHYEMFSALGILSPSVARAADTAMPAPKELINAQFDTIWVSCGDSDQTVSYPNVKKWSESLTSEGVHNQFVTYTGGHTWDIWQMALADFVPLLFKRGGQ